ncbi:hypothetical protein HMPREF0972_00447 [Actinomyces sp. oral taxon 848 str. F0332]|nr:hypothetical protein HMPREF0972_00447 [Actinomyces sp. oral taxon 848 str. F0332]
MVYNNCEDTLRSGRVSTADPESRGCLQCCVVETACPRRRPFIVETACPRRRPFIVETACPRRRPFIVETACPRRRPFIVERDGVNLCADASAGSSVDALKRRPQVAGLECGPLLRR